MLLFLKLLDFSIAQLPRIIEDPFGSDRFGNRPPAPRGYFSGGRPGGLSGGRPGGFSNRSSDSYNRPSSGSSGSDFVGRSPGSYGNSDWSRRPSFGSGSGNWGSMDRSPSYGSDSSSYPSSSGNSSLNRFRLLNCSLVIILFKKFVILWNSYSHHFGILSGLSLETVSDVGRLDIVRLTVQTVKDERRHQK